MLGLEFPFQETSLFLEQPALFVRMAAHSSILAWRIPRTESLVGYSPWGCKFSQDGFQICFLFVF